MPELSWAARTDIGRHRKNNQDAFLAQSPLFAVADGMGGHAHGEVASAWAIKGLQELPTGYQRTELLEAVRDTHRQIHDFAADAGKGTAGTTLTGVSFEGQRPGWVLVFNVGDSRTYRLRDEALIRLTHDHSVVQELIDNGTISSEQAEVHPDRNIITRSLGDGSRLEIDWDQHEAQVGDRYLICSDGLTKEANDPEIESALSEAHDPETAVETLVELALNRGGRDNITVVVVEVKSLEAASSGDSTGVEVDTNPRPVDFEDSPTDEVSMVQAPTDVNPEVDPAYIAEVPW